MDKVIKLHCLTTLSHNMNLKIVVRAMTTNAMLFTKLTRTWNWKKKKSTYRTTGMHLRGCLTIKHCTVFFKCTCRMLTTWISRPWHWIQPNRRNSLPSLLVWHKLSPGTFCLASQTTILHHKSSLICMVVAGSCCQVCWLAAPFVRVCHDCSRRAGREQHNFHTLIPPRMATKHLFAFEPKCKI